ncbi:DUF559 domain-containing protein [Candidatus Binatus sp.]|uniref:DUF559 domain-containing protein n=1 Tax=Candidatus Binatus sp. TaxID=2811406 RepID=UPI003C73BEF8
MLFAQAARDAPTSWIAITASTTNNTSAARSRALRRDSTEAEKRLWSILRNRNLDGGQHADEKKRYDDLRTRRLQALGFRVLRFWNREVLQETEGVIQEITRMLSAERSVRRHDGGQHPHLPAAMRPASSPVK